MSSCCGKEKKTRLIYSCSGAANTGYLADSVYRRLAKMGIGAGTCLAAVGADYSGFVVSAQEAHENIVIDGCPVGCGKKIFTDKKLPFTHIVMTDFGVKKGETEITEEVIARVSKEVAEKLEESVNV